jgi:pimeloyl-ACP methyl ester carboxylesterase
MLHGAAGSARVAYVMSHPFGEEKLWSHRVFVVFARALASRGIPVLRFDYTGAGDSSGDTAQASVGTYLDDLGAAVRVLAEKVPTATRIGVVGLRFGATLAAQFVERERASGASSKVLEAPLVLWDPILDGDGYIQELLRINLSTQLAVYGKVQESRDALVERIRQGGIANVEGYEIGLPLLESAALKELLPADGIRHAGGMLVVQIAATEKQKTREDQQQFAAVSHAANFERTQEQPFWREIKPFCARAENLQNLTLQWLEQRHG